MSLWQQSYIYVYMQVLQLFTELMEPFASTDVTLSDTLTLAAISLH
jgi:hypothetical protein